jgi:transposase
MNLTWSTPWSMRQLSGFIATARAQKVDSKSGHRHIEGRPNDQDPGADRRFGQSPRFVLLPGQRYDTIGMAPLIKGVEFDGLIADKAFDANWVIAELNQRGVKIVVSQMPQRKQLLDIDREVYKWRHLIENFFYKLKELKRIAMRSNKTDTSFAAMTYLGSAIINSR